MHRAARTRAELLHYEHGSRGVLTHRSLRAVLGAARACRRCRSRPPDAPVENYGGELLATTTFDRFCEFRLGGLTFQLVHTPGETYDHLTVWIPEYRIAFTGDNIYGSFPNLYTLRGTKPRWALDYVESLERVQSWQPEILAPEPRAARSTAPTPSASASSATATPSSTCTTRRCAA